MKKAFTLAEVLITLGVIGVIAALTIPTLMQNQQEKATITALKKSFSISTNAYTSAVQDNGDPTNWNLIATGDNTGALNALNILIPYLKITQNCGTGVGCFPNYSPSGGGANYSMNNTGWAKVVLADGISFATYALDPNCTSAGIIAGDKYLNSVCIEIAVDVNGIKPPNIFGQDYFRFWVSKYGVVPFGTPNTPVGSGYAFSNRCLTGRPESCAAWVIYNENMDYLHCSGLDWDVKTKCD